MKLRSLSLFVILCSLNTTAIIAQKLNIVSQRNLETRQGQPITIALSDLTVEADDKHNYPNGFYIEIDDDDDYSVSGSTIIPDRDFTGRLKVKIRVTNGDRKSGKFNLEINVLASGAPVGGDANVKGGGKGDDKDGDKGKGKGKGGKDDDDKDKGDKDDDDRDGEDDDGDDKGDDEDDNDDNDNDNDNGNGSGNGGNNGGGNNGGGNNGGNNNGGNNGGAGQVNVRPSITSQTSVAIDKNKSFRIELEHLVVSDTDDDYPNDFTLKVERGENYSVSGTIVTPVTDFIGELVVNVKVNDGQEDSDVYKFKISVKEAAVINAKPVITAHASLSTFKDEAVTIRLTDLSVTDPDNSYPSDFALVIMGGTDYSFAGNVVTPAAGFTGVLVVKVKVNDGKDDSNIFDVKIKVIERGTLQILGQSSISMLEDSSYVFALGDFNVNDPSDSYPSGFALTVLAGENYEADGRTIRPRANYYGNLSVPVRVTKGETSSNVFQALVVVRPVNDPPAFETFDDTPVASPAIASEVRIASEIKTADVDNEKLAYAEIELDTPNVQTTLSFTNTENIRGVYDQNAGILVFLGEAPLSEYDRAIQSVAFSSTDSLRKEVEITFRLNDGNVYSLPYVKTISNEGEELELVIPTAFTPNNDNANDTWEISLVQLTEETQVELRIYNETGVLLFESDSFANRWDGRFNGDLLPADSYFYTLIVSDATRRVRRNGVVTILR